MESGKEKEENEKEGPTTKIIGRDVNVISYVLSDSAPCWLVCVGCRMRENDKYVTKTSLSWQLCKDHSKIDI